MFNQYKIACMSEGEETAKIYIFNIHSYGSASLRTVILDKSCIVNVPQMTLLSGSPNTNVPYDPNTNTGEALSPFLETDEFNDIEKLLNL